MTPNPSMPTVCASSISPLMQYASRKGCCTQALLAPYQLDQEALGQAERRLPIAMADSLYGAVFQQLDLPDLGLRVGKLIGSNSYSVLQILLLSCSSLREAFQYLIRYYSLWSDEPAPIIEINGPQSRLALNFQPDAHLARIEAQTRAYLHWFRLHCGLKFQFQEAHFPTNVPDAHRQLLRTYFGPQTAFDTQASNVTLIMETGWLDTQCRQGNPAVTQALEAEAARILRQIKPEQSSFSSRHAEYLCQQLREGKLGWQSSLEEAASVLGLSGRSLSRSLQQDGLSYRELLAAERLKRAREQLQEPLCDIEDLACSLGYSSRRALDRAFQKWTSTSPAQYRRQYLDRAG